MRFVKEKRQILLFLGICGILYLGLLYFLDAAGAYHLSPNANNDRFFSMDDIHYVKEIYSLEMENTLRIVKHPLFMVFGNLFTRLEHGIFGDINIRSHYILIVLMQISVQLAAVFYLYKILDEFYKLHKKVIFLLLSIYAFSVSVLFFTLFAESYIFSAAVLILTYYCSLKKNQMAVIILGVAAAGVTITNFAIWMIMIVMLWETTRSKIRIVVCAAVLFLLVVLLFPVRQIFFTKFFYVFVNSPANYSDTFGLMDALRRIFYSIFGTTVFYVDTANTSPFGELSGRAVSFLPSSGILTAIFIFLWMGLLLYSSLMHYKERMFLAPMMVLLFNLFLHGVVQYGLKEAFLYSLHHFFAQILIAAALFTVRHKPGRKIALTILLVFFAGEILLNLGGYRDFYTYVRELAQ